MRRVRRVFDASRDENGVQVRRLPGFSDLTEAAQPPWSAIYAHPRALRRAHAMLGRSGQLTNIDGLSVVDEKSENGATDPSESEEEQEEEEDNDDAWIRIARAEARPIRFMITFYDDAKYDCHMTAQAVHESSI